MDRVAASRYIASPTVGVADDDAEADMVEDDDDVTAFGSEGVEAAVVVCADAEACEAGVELFCPTTNMSAT